MTSLKAILRDAGIESLPALHEHSAEVKPGDAFIAAAAEVDAATAHARGAIERGAQIVLSAQPLQDNSGVPVVVVPELADQRGNLVAEYYDHPSRQMMTFAVTGTNGKTSLAFHIADLSRRLNVCCGYMGTLGWGFTHDVREPGLTTPNPTAVQRRFAALRDRGARRVALEVSSHALAQDRVQGTHIDVAVFTNLTRDHLDYHQTMQAYGEAKMRLFTDWPLQGAVLYAGDPFSRDIAARTNAPVMTYGADSSADLRWRRGQGDDVIFSTGPEEITVTLAVAADFVLDNLAGAMAALITAGHSLVDLAAVLPGFRGVPGRLEVVSGVGQPRVVVDYAHTPDAVEKALSALRENCAGRLICVVGCGGDRDPGKRPQMAGAASRLADEVWLTSDNPRSEDPETILADMQPGLVSVAHMEPDRAAAIRGAITAATPRDVVLIAGKGHEDYQEIKGKRLPFDDRVVARNVLGDR